MLSAQHAKHISIDVQTMQLYSLDKKRMHGNRVHPKMRNTNARIQLDLIGWSGADHFMLL